MKGRVAGGRLFTCHSRKGSEPYNLQRKVGYSPSQAHTHRSLIQVRQFKRIRENVANGQIPTGKDVTYIKHYGGRKKKIQSSSAAWWRNWWDKTAIINDLFSLSLGCVVLI